MVDTTGDTVGLGNTDIPLHADWAWNVDVFAAHRNPSQCAFGVTGCRAFTLNPAYRDSLSDSLYLLWGGNSIKNPVIY